MRAQIPRIYSQDLLNIIFSHPYTKIEFAVRELRVTRYLDEMTRIGMMTKVRLGRESYYVNDALYDLLSNVHEA